MSWSWNTWQHLAWVVGIKGLVGAITCALTVIWAKIPFCMCKFSAHFCSENPFCDLRRSLLLCSHIAWTVLVAVHCWGAYNTLPLGPISCRNCCLSFTHYTRGSKTLLCLQRLVQILCRTKSTTWCLLAVQSSHVCVCDIFSLYTLSWLSIVTTPGQHIHSPVQNTWRLPFYTDELEYKLASVAHKKLRFVAGL